VIAAAAASGGQEMPMQIPGEAARLRIYIGVNDTFEDRPLVEAIVARARAAGMAGATAIRGMTGFGQSSHIHRIELVLSHDLPIVIEIVDERSKIDGFLAVVQAMIGSGLVTVEPVTVLRYGATTSKQE
jgi:PII-like signaling protein